MSFFCRDMIAIQLATTLREAQQQAVALGALAVEQGDLLGVLAHAHQVEAEVGFVALLLEIERDQRRGRSGA